MNNLTLSFTRETGQAVLEGLPAGAAGGAFLAPVLGLDLVFDRVDGRLCRVAVSAVAADGSIGMGEQVAAMLIRLLGPRAPSAVLRAAARPGQSPPETCGLAPEPGLAGTLSSLARIHAAQVTSPVPPDSPGWAAEAAELAACAGLPAPARTPAGPGLAGLPPVPVLNVAAEVTSLAPDRAHPAGLQWMLDPGLAPAGVFRFGLSPYSDLMIRPEEEQDRIAVAALIAPGADRGALSGCRVRLVDPAVRRILAQAGCTVSGAWARAELRLPFPLDELPESWIEVTEDKLRPVSSTRGHRIRRALRWADAALRAERFPAALDPAATARDWYRLAAAAWARCRLDWAAAGDADRAYLAATRQAAFDSTTRRPRAPSATAAEIARQAPLAGPAYRAEAGGRLAPHGRGPGTV